MRFYNQTGPDTAVSYGPFFAICYWIGYIYLRIIGLVLAATVVAFLLAIAVIIGFVLMVNGVIYHALTGRDARIPVPGSNQGTHLEYWMEDKGWIRLPKRLMHTRSMSRG